MYAGAGAVPCVPFSAVTVSAPTDCPRQVGVVLASVICADT